MRELRYLVHCNILLEYAYRLVGLKVIGIWGNGGKCTCQAMIWRTERSG